MILKMSIGDKVRTFFGNHKSSIETAETEYIENLKVEADSGNKAAIHSLITIYKDGIKDVIPPDISMAAKYMRLAADAGDMNMSYLYAMLLETSDPCYQAYMKEAAEHHVPEAMFQMYRLWHNNLNESRRKEAKVYLTGAADRRYPDALEEIRNIAGNAGRSEEEIHKLIAGFTGNDSDAKIRKRMPGDDTLTKDQMADLMAYHKEIPEHN